MSGALLRIALAPLARLEDEPLDYAWLGRRGELLHSGAARLATLAGEARGKPLELALHPLDSLLASVSLPPLPAARLGDAVALAADGLVLGERDALQLVHGPREADGRVQLAWLERRALAELLARFAAHGLRPRALFPAPFFLPVLDGGCCATLLDGQLLVRSGPHSGWLHPLPEQAGERLDECPRLAWVGAGAPVGAEPLAAEQRWLGPAPVCDLLRGWRAQARRPARWGRALACCLLAMSIWSLGLYWQAARLAGEGQALQRQMVERVRQAFPELPVVLDPLQQARRQLESRQAGSGFDGLLRRAETHMPFLVGRLEALDYDGTALRLTRRAGMPAGEAAAGWREALAKAGVQVAEEEHGWRLSAGEEIGDEP